jgi:hypothetical protein
VPGRQDRADGQTVERVIELAETRKSLDSLNPPPPTPMLTPMAPMNNMSVLASGDTAPSLATPPTDADG